MFPRVLVALVSVLLASCSQWSGRPPVQIAIFSEGGAMDLPKSVFTREILGNAVTLKVIPEFTQDNIVAFHPFAAEDGTQGVCLQLDVKGRNSLEVVTRLQQGKILASMVNGAFVDLVNIDGTIANGLFTVWQGIPNEAVAKMDKKYPRIQVLKQSGGQSSSSSMDMVPSTTSEKREAMRRSRGKPQPSEGKPALKKR